MATRPLETCPIPGPKTCRSFPLVLCSLVHYNNDVRRITHSLQHPPFLPHFLSPFPLPNMHPQSLNLVTAHPTHWLWPNRFALGKLALLDGDPGLGKSLVTLNL